MSRRCLALVMICTAATGAAADSEPSEPWYAGSAGNRRILHLGISVVGGLALIASDTVLEPTLTSTECRWCEPPAFDHAVRDRVVWDDTRRADILSSVTAYGLGPVVGLGLLFISDHDAGAKRLLDDTIPVFESVVVAALVVQTLKFSFARPRPFVRHGEPGDFESEHHLSFPSGHSSIGFAITASAGLVCHWRGYKTEPYVWVAGIALSLSTEYLRMAADKHYLSDVLVGGAIGLTAGLLVPRLMRENISVVPAKNGIAIATAF